MITLVLRENVLTDNELIVSEKGYVFKGGYIAILKEYSFAKAWSDKLSNVLRFRSKERLFKFLDKNYPDFECDFEGTSLS